MSNNRSLKRLTELYASLKRGRSAASELNMMRSLKSSASERDIPPNKLKICIVGGGMAGLYSGLLFKTLDIPFKLYEASDRIGGRIKTHWLVNGKPNEDEQFLYAEYGAMRIPIVPDHGRVFSLVETLKLEEDWIEYKMSDSNNLNLKYFNKQCFTDAELKGQSDLKKLNFPVPARLENNRHLSNNEALKSADDIIDELVGHFVDALKKDTDPEKKASMKLLLEYDEHSLRSYLRLALEARGVLKEDIEPFGILSFLDLMASSTSLFDLSLSEFVLDAYCFQSQNIEWCTMNGGMEKIPVALEQMISDKETNNVQKNTCVTKITHMRNGKIKVTAEQKKTDQTEIIEEEFDHVIVTVPLPVVRHIVFTSEDSHKESLPYKKREAIRDFGYDHSCKIFLRFNRRWWEEDLGICGGSSFTDLPLRVVVYPSYGKGSKNAVLLASYTWGADAVRWAGMTAKQRTYHALEYIKEMHAATKKITAEDIQKEFLECDASICWTNEPYELGAFSYLYPCQFGEMQEVVAESCDNIHFAGEHADMLHAWIAGSLNSAFNVVDEITRGISARTQEWEDKWGKEAKHNLPKLKSELKSEPKSAEQPKVSVTTPYFTPYH